MVLLIRELFTLDYKDNKNTTNILEQIAAMGATAFIRKLKDPKKEPMNFYHLQMVNRLIIISTNTIKKEQ